jgi:8-oxo-dGTP pyrophosphatase MutT (NUDIX family)
VTWERIERALASRGGAPLSDPDIARAAVAVILRDGARGIEILFIRRAEHPRDPWSGQMAFPGGRSEPGDEDLCATARRETAEEIAVDLATAGELLGPLDEVRAMARLQPLRLAIAPFVFRLRRRAEVRMSAEVCSVHWLPLDELLGAGPRSTLDYAHEQGTLQFPCLRLDEIVIWGLTYRMFMSLAERLGGSEPGPLPGERDALR